MPRRSATVMLALATNAPSLQVRSRPRDEPFVLNLRGGAEDAAPPAAPSVAPTALTPEEITEKLNRVPTFCIMQGDGSVISLPDPAGAEGDECCTWFTDAAEAQYTFKRVCAANPELVDEGLRLQTHGLGDVFAMCGGSGRDPGG